jgi:hypothetical protein
MTFRPACPACGNHLLPCTATANGVHPEGLPATVPTLSGMVEAGGFKSDAACFEVVHSRVINTKGNPKFNGG